MKNFTKHIILILLVIFSTTSSHAQSNSGTKGIVKGTINDYYNQPIYIYQCYGDTLLLVDSAKTDNKGQFSASPLRALSGAEGAGSSEAGMFKFHLQRNQFFYILNDDQPIEIRTVFRLDAMYNIASDSLKVIKSEENKRFYEFQHLQMPINVANTWLLQMMRLYPLFDPFHKQIEDEYFIRYKTMEQFIKKNSKEVSSPPLGGGREGLLVALAYYQPVNPDWKQPDPWRDSITALHYFDYFNPSEPFYLNSNVLPEKMNNYVALKVNKRDAYGQPIHDEMLVKTAMQEFLENTKSNRKNLDFCLNYFLKKLNKDKQFNALLEIYDNYVKPVEGDCESTNKQFDWIRAKAGVLRNIKIGNIAPDFEIHENLRMQQLTASYTLLIFWASWCPHCIKSLPEIQKVCNDSKAKGLDVIAISLDSDNKEWQKIIQQDNLSSWFNTSELKGWNGEVPRKYNVYATPTMFLLDKDKKIIARPETVEQLIQALQ